MLHTFLYQGKADPVVVAVAVAPACDSWLTCPQIPRGWPRPIPYGFQQAEPLADPPNPNITSWLSQFPDGVRMPWTPRPDHTVFGDINMFTSAFTSGWYGIPDNPIGRRRPPYPLIGCIIFNPGDFTIPVTGWASEPEVPVSRSPVVPVIQASPINPSEVITDMGGWAPFVELPPVREPRPTIIQASPPNPGETIVPTTGYAGIPENPPVREVTPRPVIASPINPNEVIVPTTGFTGVPENPIRPTPQARSESFVPLPSAEGAAMRTDWSGIPDSPIIRETPGMSYGVQPLNVLIPGGEQFSGGDLPVRGTPRLVVDQTPGLPPIPVWGWQVIAKNPKGRPFQTRTESMNPPAPEVLVVVTDRGWMSPAETPVPRPYVPPAERSTAIDPLTFDTSPRSGWYNIPEGAPNGVPRDLSAYVSPLNPNEVIPVDTGWFNQPPEPPRADAIPLHVPGTRPELLIPGFDPAASISWMGGAEVPVPLTSRNIGPASSSFFDPSEVYVQPVGGWYDGSTQMARREWSPNQNGPYGTTQLQRRVYDYRRKRSG